SARRGPGGGARRGRRLAPPRAEGTDREPAGGQSERGVEAEPNRPGNAPGFPVKRAALHEERGHVERIEVEDDPVSRPRSGSAGEKDEHRSEEHTSETPVT